MRLARPPGVTLAYQDLFKEVVIALLSAFRCHHVAEACRLCARTYNGLRRTEVHAMPFDAVPRKPIAPEIANEIRLA